MEPYYCSLVSSRCSFRYNFQYFHNSILSYLCCVFRLYYAYYKIFLIACFIMQRFSVFDSRISLYLTSVSLFCTLFRSLCMLPCLFVCGFFLLWLIACVMLLILVLYLYAFKYFSYISLTLIPRKAKFCFIVRYNSVIIFFFCTVCVISMFYW